MEQIKFIYMANSMQVESVNQDEVGNTVVVVRDGVNITHNYKKNRMKLTFNEDNVSYVIPSGKELEAIYRMHLENKELMYILRDYCSKNLNKEESANG